MVSGEQWLFPVKSGGFQRAMDVSGNGDSSRRWCQRRSHWAGYSGGVGRKMKEVVGVVDRGVRLDGSVRSDPIK